MSSTFSRVVNQFSLLHQAYNSAGLLGEGAVSELAKQLLGEREKIAQFRREFLLIDALVRNRVGRALEIDDGFRHLVVFGGNNVGKSTVVNSLAGQYIAGVSAEGGSTTQAEAFFAPGLAPHGELFHMSRLTRHGGAIAQAPREKPANEYKVAERSLDRLPKNVVLWDTPDCDSTDAASYLPDLIEAVTMADILIYVTTEEKAAVDTLVEWILLLQSAGLETLECLNKTELKNQAQIIESQRVKHFPRAAAKLNLPSPDFPIVCLLRMSGIDREEDFWDTNRHPQVQVLRDQSLSLLGHSDRRLAAARALDFALARIDQILEPIQIEIDSIKRWETAVDAGIDGFIRIYEEQYLTSDKAVEPIQKVNLKLLELLNPNIPWLKDVREVLKGPTRAVQVTAGTIFKELRKRLRPDAAAPTSEADSNENKETIAYQNAHLHLLEDLRKVIETARKPGRHHPFWDALASIWDDERQRLNEEFSRLVAQHIEETDKAINQAANDIYATLEERPAVLKVLKGAALGANVVGVAATLFVPHAGIFGFDLLEEAILTPAVMAALDAATQTAVKGFVTMRQTQLISKLKNDAAGMAASLYRAPLQHIIMQVERSAGAISVSAEVLDELPEGLRQLRAKFLQMPEPV